MTRPLQLTLACVLCFGALSGLWASAQPFLEPYHAQAFALEQATQQGFGDWEIAEFVDHRGEYRILFQSPTDAGSYNDMTVAKIGDKWGIVQLIKGFRPWKGAERSR